MLIIRLGHRNLSKVSELNYNINLALVGNQAFIDNDICISPIKYDEASGKYYFDILLGESSTMNVALEVGSMKIETYEKKYD